MVFFFIAALLAAVVVLVWTGARKKNSVRRAGARERTARKRRPRRCCGQYIPDCEGCPFFRKNLFDASVSEEKKGHCCFFGYDLIVAPKDTSSHVILEGDGNSETGEEERG